MYLLLLQTSATYFMLACIRYLTALKVSFNIASLWDGNSAELH